MCGLKACRKGATPSGKENQKGSGRVDGKVGERFSYEQ